MQTMLVVEDDSLLRDVLASILTKEGFAVLEAQDGQEAVELLSVHDHIQIVLSDIRMPRMGGFQLLEWIKKHKPKVRVFLMSGYSDELNTKNPTEHGASGFFAKPFDKDSLITALKSKS